MNTLAEIYRLEGRYWEARNLAEAATRALGLADPQSPDMPVFLNNWAGLERDLQRRGSSRAVAPRRGRWPKTPENWPRFRSLSS